MRGRRNRAGVGGFGGGDCEVLDVVWVVGKVHSWVSPLVVGGVWCLVWCLFGVEKVFEP